MNENLHRVEYTVNKRSERIEMGPGLAVRPIVQADTGSWADKGGAAQAQKANTRRLRFKGVLGEGGMAVVKEAYDADLLRSAAVKMIRPGLPDNDLARQSLVEEAQITAQLDHPSIVPVYDIGQDEDDAPYFAMKLVNGRLLSEILQERDCLERTEEELFDLLQIFCKICDAISYAHSRGVVHRDLKPQNIMVGDFGQVYVIDWGVAGIKGGACETNTSGGDPNAVSCTRGSQSRCTTPIGTLGYMSPEQTSGDLEDLDERTDIFGLGGILYEILTGASPYPIDDDQARSPAELVRQVLVQMARGHVSSPYERTRAHLPPRLCNIAMKALRKAPVDRYQTAAELKQDVESFYLSGGLRRFAVAEHEKNKRRLERAVSELERSKEELRRANERLRLLAATDPLTGLANRRRGLELLNGEMSRVERGRQSLSVIMIDLDHFKQINDTFGHAAGDGVLVEVAERLKKGCRPHDEVVRWGGDELLVICPHAGSDQALTVAGRLCRAISDRPVQIPGAPAISVSASLGTASSDPFPGAHGQELIERADQALYEAKQDGRNCVRRSRIPRLATAINS